jgi:hypothetical protein
MPLLSASPSLGRAPLKLLWGRPKSVASQASDLHKGENSITPFDCPGDKVAPGRWVTVAVATSRTTAGLVAAPWRLQGDAVRSDRYAGKSASADYQGALGARCHACLRLDGCPCRAGGRSSHHPPDGQPPAPRHRASHPGGSSPGAAPASGAPGPERTSGAGAAWHAGRRARGRVRGVRATASVRLGSGPVAGPVHPARSSGAAPTPAGLTAVPRRLLIRRGLMLEVPLIVSSPRVAPGRRAAPARSGRLGGGHPPGPPGPGPTGRHPDRPGSQGRPSPAGRR